MVIISGVPIFRVFTVFLQFLKRKDAFCHEQPVRILVRAIRISNVKACRVESELFTGDMSKDSHSLDNVHEMRSLQSDCIDPVP